MFFYILVIAVSVFLFNISVSKYDNNKGISILFFVVYVIFTAAVGGLRDLTVGHDLMAYGIMSYEKTIDYKKIIDIFTQNASEYGYHFLNWLCHEIYDDIHFFLFVEETIKATCIGCFAIINRNKIPPVLFVLLYMFFMYVDGFNIIRQSIAIVIYIWGLIYLFKKKYIVYVFFCIFGFLFHSSSIMGILVLFPIFLYKLNLKWYITVLCLILLYRGYYSIMNFISTLGDWQEGKVALYLSREEVANIAKSQLLFLAVIFLIYLNLKDSICKMKDGEWLSSLFENTAILNLFFLLLAPILEIAFRIAWYYTFVLIFMSLWFIKSSDSHNKKNFYCALLLTLILDFVLKCMHGYSEAVPYTSSILGIE